jgi:hypothetical protein
MASATPRRVPKRVRPIPRTRHLCGDIAREARARCLLRPSASPRARRRRERDEKDGVGHQDGDVGADVGDVSWTTVTTKGETIGARTSWTLGARRSTA